MALCTNQAKIGQFAVAPRVPILRNVIIHN